MCSGQHKEQLPSAIPPNGEGTALFVKTNLTACGAVGVITYDLWTICDNTPNKIAVMFSAPFNNDLYYNLFAVGVFDKRRNCDKSLYKDMYYNNLPDFTRFHADGKFYEYVDHIAVITAHMTVGHEATVTIDIKRPLHDNTSAQ